MVGAVVVVPIVGDVVTCCMLVVKMVEAKLIPTCIDDVPTDETGESTTEKDRFVSKGLQKVIPVNSRLGIILLVDKPNGEAINERFHSSPNDPMKYHTSRSFVSSG